MGDLDWDQFALVRFVALKPIELTTMLLTEGFSGFVADVGVSVNASRIRFEPPSLTIHPKAPAAFAALGAPPNSVAVPIENRLLDPPSALMAMEDPLELDGVCVPRTAEDTATLTHFQNAISRGEGEVAGDAIPLWAATDVVKEDVLGITLATSTSPASTYDPSLEHEHELYREFGPHQFAEATLLRDVSAAPKRLAMLYANCVDEIMRQEPAAFWNP